ncbi:MAG TPA: carbohydrate ABC transporter permease [Chthonomonadaceae bacterium]|nr:carbohydrate ABC transporter permease [Chthonomonadaceae bacterium]
MIREAASRKRAARTRPQAERQHSSARRRRELALHLPLALLVALTFYPFLFLLQTSLKDNPQFFHDFWGLHPPFHWSNYADAWGAINHYIGNTLIVTISTVIGTVAVAALSAYTFARHRFPGREFLFYAILSLMMVPGVLTLISAFMWMKHFPLAGGNDLWGEGGNGLLNSHLALILPGIAGGQVFAIFILRSFMASLPEELFEAARIDGAGEWLLFSRIAVPLSRPILGTIAIMGTLSTWNDYVWPYIVLSDDARKTLSVGLAFFRGAYATTYGPLMAGYVLASLPLLVLFLLTMRTFISGLTSGALKG